MIKSEKLTVTREKEEQIELEKPINQVLMEAVEGLTLYIAELEARIEALENK